jgi:hypothetical protein
MPFTDPHVAVPCLWAIRQEYGPQFEMSWVTLEAASDRSQQLAIEEALIVSSGVREKPHYKPWSYHPGVSTLE